MITQRLIRHSHNTTKIQMSDGIVWYCWFLKVIGNYIINLRNYVWLQTKHQMKSFLTAAFFFFYSSFNYTYTEE